MRVHTIAGIKTLGDLRKSIGKMDDWPDDTRIVGLDACSLIAPHDDSLPNDPAAAAHSR